MIQIVPLEPEISPELDIKLAGTLVVIGSVLLATFLLAITV